MTEQEAKILASELEYHHDWQVCYCFPVLPRYWAVLLKHRQLAQWVAKDSTDPARIKDLLAGRGKSALTSFAIDLKRF